LGSEISTLGYFDDLAVDICYRGMGIYNKMHALKEDVFVPSAKYIFSTTVNPIVIKSWIKRNRALLPFTVTRMIKSNNIDHLIKEKATKNRYLVKFGHVGLKNINKMRNIFRTPIKLIDDFQISEVSEFDEGVDSFWDKIKYDYNFILEKKYAFLNWRFTDNDRGNHAKFQAVAGDEVLGYVVVGFKPGSGEGQIVDILALKDRLDVTDALFNSALGYLDSIGVNIVYYQVVVGHPYQEISKRKGFLDSRSRPTISFDYSVNWLGYTQSKIPFLEGTKPGQVYFTYATTL
jgi:hypothetical protein